MKLLLITVSAIAVGACAATTSGEQSTPPASGQPEPAETAPTDNSTPKAVESEDSTSPASASPGIANPASEHCVKNGGRVSIEKEAEGEAGYCVFPDGSRCPEWEYFRGECKPGDHQ